MQQDAGVILAGLVVLFAVFFTTFGVALIKGADLRPIGNLAIPVGILAALYLTFDGFNDTFLFQSSTILWGVVFLLVAGFTYGEGWSQAARIRAGSHGTMGGSSPRCIWHSTNPSLEVAGTPGGRIRLQTRLIVRSS